MGRIANAKRIVNEIAYSTGLKLNSLQKFGILLDYMNETYLHGVRPVEYIQFDFYWKSKRDRRRYACLREYDEIVKVSNKREDWKFFDEKPLFNKTFSEFLNRDWLDLSTCDYIDFEQMAQKHERLFVKPEAGWFGNGAYILEIKGQNLRQLYEKLKKEQVIAEEVVEQHKELAAFNASSANTLRVVTMLCPDGDVKIMAAILRMGRSGRVVDNFHFFGIAALIDVETGYVKTTGVDKTYQRYVAHPDSGKVIPGFRIPNWNEIVATVKKAAKVVPTVRYVGWDIAVSSEGRPVIIEGNKSAEPDAEQISERSGHWPMYKEMLDIYRKEDQL